MRVTDRVEMLEVKVESPFGTMTFCPTFIWEHDSAVLVDTGMPGQWGLIRSMLTEAGAPVEKLNTIILTHQDLDHIGGMPEILGEGGNLNVFAHKMDQPYIEGDRPLIKADLSKMPEEKLNALPNELRQIYENPPKAKVTHSLTGGEVLPFSGGMTVIHTPGHTPGHISLYLNRSKTLFAADAMVAKDGHLHGPVPMNTPDMAQAIQSLENFLQYDIDQVICYHGGLVKGDINAEIRRVIDENKSV